MANKYYAVRVGRKTGIFNSWTECQKEVIGFPNAIFKSFGNYEDALNYMGLNANEKKKATADIVAYVDGSFNKEIHAYSYGLIMLEGERIFHEEAEAFDDPTLIGMRNVAGELAGAMQAMRIAEEKNIAALCIVHDYIGIEKWCTGEWKTNKEGTKAYQAFCEEAKHKIDISFEKVKSHSGDYYNDRVDQLAKKALEDFNKGG